MVSHTVLTRPAEGIAAQQPVEGTLRQRGQHAGLLLGLEQGCRQGLQIFRTALQHRAQMAPCGFVLLQPLLQQCLSDQAVAAAGFGALLQGCQQFFFSRSGCIALAAGEHFQLQLTLLQGIAHRGALDALR